MTTNVVAAVFPDNATTYQALSNLKSSAAGSVVTAAAIVERGEDGTIRIPEGADADAGTGFTVGGLTGLLVGVLGGPLGLILGWGLGAATGALIDASRQEESGSVLTEFSSFVPAGKNALVLETEENETDTLDSFIKGLGGEVRRRPYDEVLGEVETQEEAAAAAREAADKSLREQKKNERKEQREKRLADLKAKFS